MLLDLTLLLKKLLIESVLFVSINRIDLV